VLKGGRKPGVTDPFEARRYLCSRVKVNAPKDDTRSHWCRTQGEVDFLSSMQTYACRTDYVLEGSLPDHPALLCWFF
jgi:hypothetical protein